MTKVLLIGLVLVSLLGVTTAAQAHRGDIWYDTAANTAGYVEDKHQGVRTARCVPLPLRDRVSYQADSYVRGNGVRVWDHFLCGIVNTRGALCFTVAHISGRRWSDFYLTSFRFRGCSPYALR